MEQCCQTHATYNLSRIIVLSFIIVSLSESSNHSLKKRAQMRVALRLKLVDYQAKVQAAQAAGGGRKS
jgi:hypothetical protein